MSNEQKVLDNQDLKKIEKELSNLLTKYNPLSGFNPFKNKDGYELIGEEFQYGCEDFFNRLIEVSKRKESDAFYIARYEVSEMNSDLKLTEGYSISNNIDYEKFDDLGNEITYTVNSTSFLYFDKTFTWCIMTFLDTQLLFGDNEFMKAYFENE